IEPFLKDPSEIESSCPMALRGLLKQVIAIRASKTACVLGYWGHWREASALMHQFTSARNWRLPYHASAAVCSTPIGPMMGALHRAVRGKQSMSQTNGHSSPPKAVFSRLQTPDSRLKIVAVVEATNVNAVAKNVFEFHRAATDLHQQAA